MKNDYEIVSLGYNCQPRTYLTHNELIKTRKNGRKSMVFDLTIHLTRSLGEILKTDFSDYFENLEYDFYEPFGLNYWQIKKYGVIFNHDSDCKQNDFEKIKTRYEKRVKNFQEELKSDKFLFFVHNIDEFATEQDINELYKTLKIIRGEKPFKLIIWDAFENFEKDNINKEIAFCQLLHPYDDISDWFKPEKQNAVSKLWNQSLINFVKIEIENNGFEVQFYKRPFRDILKEKIKPILKNIFTITNDAELNAKVLILLGFKFKIKELKKNINISSD